MYKKTIKTQTRNTCRYSLDCQERKTKTIMLYNIKEKRRIIHTMTSL